MNVQRMTVTQAPLEAAIAGAKPLPVPPAWRAAQVLRALLLEIPVPIDGKIYEITEDEESGNQLDLFVQGTVQHNDDPPEECLWRADMSVKEFLGLLQRVTDEEYVRLTMTLALRGMKRQQAEKRGG